MKMIPNKLRLGPLDGHRLDPSFDSIVSLDGSRYRRAPRGQYVYDPSMSQDQRTKDERIEGKRIADKWDPPAPASKARRILRWNPFRVGGLPR